MKHAISIKQAEQRISSAIHPLGITSLPLEAAVGHILAENITAPFPLPKFTQSAMDGYAVRAADLQKASHSKPVRLKMVETIAAGHLPTFRLHAGETVAIMTGGQMPGGSDAVVVVEEGVQQGHHVLFHHPTSRWAHIRKQGEIIKRNQLILKKGRKLTGSDIGILATFNHATVKISRKPRVAIFSTGDELVPLGQSLPNGKIIDSNRPMLITELNQLGIPVIDLGIIHDRWKSTLQALKQASKNADVIITLGGVSMGQFDYVGKGIKRLGQLHFSKVRMKPGGPFTLGLIQGKPVFALPGNPVSALLIYQLFVKPALQTMAGETMRPIQWKSCLLTYPLHSHTHKTLLQYARMEQHGDKWHAAILPNKGSHDLTAAQQANAIVLSPPGKGRTQTGHFYLLRFIRKTE